MISTVLEKVLQYSYTQPNKVALYLKDKEISYELLGEKIKKTAVILKNIYGLKKNDRLMVTGVTSIDFVILYFAAHYIGVTVFPVDKTFKEESLVSFKNLINPTYIITAIGYKVFENNITFEQIAYEVSRLEKKDIMCFESNTVGVTETCTVIFTSGTTGTPKGACLSISNFVSTIENCIDVAGYTESDVFIDPLPMHHVFGIRVLSMGLYLGATVVLQNGIVFPKELINNIINHNCTVLSCVPYSLETLYKQIKEDFAKYLGRLKVIEVSSGSLSMGMKKQLTEILISTNIYNYWGSSESCSSNIYLDLKNDKDYLSSIGRPMKSIEAFVVDESGCIKKADNIDTAGKLAIKSDTLMQCYFNNPELTTKTLINDFYVTSDLVYINELGYIYMLGRADNIMNIGGEKVSPIEIENICQESLLFDECACIGVNDLNGNLGQIPVLFYVNDKEISERELNIFLSRRIDRIKFPRKLIKIEQLPRNKLLKLDRNKLVQYWNMLNNDIIY